MQINSVADCDALQQDLDSLVQWSHSWLMSLNLKKCEFLRITNKKYPVVRKYYIENSPITEVSCTKYLGATINCKLCWNEHIQRLTTKAI